MTNYKDIKRIPIVAADVPNLDTAKITTGTMASARISEASVTQHVTATDLQPIKSDISALALREATNESSAAFNLPNQFIETFTDDTNLGTQTTGDRVSGAWQTQVTTSGEFTDDSNTRALLHFNGSDAGTTFTDSSSNNRTITRYGTPTTVTGVKKYGSASGSFNGSNQGISMPDSNHWVWATGDWTFETWVYLDTNVQSSGNTTFELFNQAKTDSTDAGGSFHWNLNHYSGNSKQQFNVYHRNSTTTSDDFAVTSNSNLALSTWIHLAVVRDGNTIRFYKDGVADGTGSVPSSSGYHLMTGALGGSAWISKRAYSNGYGYVDGNLDEMRISNTCRYPNGTTFTPQQQTTTNATGTLIQSANVVGSAKTKVGGTMLYKDNAGTATLGTDLKIYFTCDGGSNWTEATSYSAITPVYSTGIKQVRLGETTCTSGTDVRYKAVWANQAASSKETQLHGIGVNY